jgi:hypothetical protein
LLLMLSFLTTHTQFTEILCYTTAKWGNEHLKHLWRCNDFATNTGESGSTIACSRAAIDLGVIVRPRVSLQVKRRHEPVIKVTWQADMHIGSVFCPGGWQSLRHADVYDALNWGKWEILRSSWLQSSTALPHSLFFNSDMQLI